MAKRRHKGPEAVEGEVLPAQAENPDNGQDKLFRLVGKGIKGDARYANLGIGVGGILPRMTQKAVIMAANRAAVLLTGNEDATEVDYLTHMAIMQPVAFMGLIGRLMPKTAEQPAGEGGIVVNAVLNIGGKSLQ